MSESLFLRLLPYEDKAAALAEAAAAVREGRTSNPVVHPVDPASFRQIPGSPFAYWVREHIRRLFTELPPFEGEGRTVKQGLATADDFRFVRAWWEVAPERILDGLSFVHNPLSFAKDQGPRIMDNRGYGIFCESSALSALIALGNSASLDYLYKVLLGRFGFPEFIVGVLQQLPVPRGLSQRSPELSHLAHAILAQKRSLDCTNEASHIFCLPAVLLMLDGKLAERIATWQARVTEVEPRLIEYQREIDDVVFSLYRIEGQDRQEIEEIPHGQPLIVSGKGSEAGNSEEDTDTTPIATGHSSLVTDLLSYAVGCALGRWDVRFATGEQLPPKLSDPFSPLPACSPGMLTGEDGLPLREAPPDYPLHIDWDGILVDDPDHSDDIVRRLREVLDLSLVLCHSSFARDQGQCGLGAGSLRGSWC